MTQKIFWKLEAPQLLVIIILVFRWKLKSRCTNGGKPRQKIFLSSPSWMSAEKGNADKYAYVHSPIVGNITQLSSVEEKD